MREVSSAAEDAGRGASSHGAIMAILPGILRCLYYLQEMAARCYWEEEAYGKWKLRRLSRHLLLGHLGMQRICWTEIVLPVHGPVWYNIVESFKADGTFVYIDQLCLKKR